jgi:hypothetical protein
MRNLALAVAAVLLVAVASPAFAQPFADVPTDHWAFDAIAELAAKGIIEGFPDGTFKGDRGVSRYEVAIIVARILARIEAIKIPAPAAPAPAPQVTRTDVQTIQRLVNEFRAELAALGVRVTAAEEELTALKAATSATKVSGELNYRYTFGPSIGAGGGGLGTSWGQALLTFVGKTGGATGTVRLNLGNDGGVFSLGGSTAAPAALGTEGGFDRAQVEFPYFGWNWRVGRQTYQLGAVGLLFQEGWVLCTVCEGVDGAVVTGSLGPVGIEVASFLHLTATQTVGQPDTSPAMARATFNVAGWTIGGSYYRESQAGGVTTNTGYGADLTGTLFPGFNLTGEWATFTPSGLAAQTAYQATLAINVSGMMGGGLNPKLSVWYKNYPPTWSPIWPGSCEAICSTIFQDLNVTGANLALTLSDQFRPYVKYETGTRTAGNFSEYEIGFRSQITSSVDARVRYQNRSNVGVTDRDRYRVELFYSW